MGTALVTSTGKPSKLLQQLLESEKIINDTAASMCRDFVTIGNELDKIKSRPELLKECNCDSWSAYCNSGRVAVSPTWANKYIECARLLPKLPDISVLNDGDASRLASWDLTVVAELSRCETVRDSQAAARKVITACKKLNQLPTVRLTRRKTQS